MADMERYQMQRTIKSNDKYISICLKIFVSVLVISGLCLFSLPFLSKKLLGFVDSLAFRGELYSFLMKIIQGVTYNKTHFPFMAYGTDFLGFAHLMFALLFVGPVIDPYKNEWVLRFGLMVCVLLVPTVLIAGWVREIPFIWRCMDSLFGVVGFLLFYSVFKKIKANQQMLEDLEKRDEKKINSEIRVA